MTITTPSGSAPGGADAVGTPNANGAGQHAGLDTCGKGESTDPIGQQTHESCCKSLPITIAGKALRYDKYEVTAGRFRQFLESLNPPYDVRGWATAQFDASFNPTTPAGTTLAAELPIKQAGVTTNVVNLLPATAETFEPLNAVIQTGALDMSTAGSQGCYTAVGDFGAATYWWDATTLYDQASSPPRPFTQDYYDIKSMNCIPSWLGAAFCAWDGGRLPLQSEHAYVWDGGTGGTGGSGGMAAGAVVSVSPPAWVATVSMAVPEAPGRVGRNDAGKSTPILVCTTRDIIRHTMAEICLPRLSGVAIIGEKRQNRWRIQAAQPVGQGKACGRGRRAARGHNDRSADAHDHRRSAACR